MISLSDIRGQDNAVRYLSNNLSSGRIANGYLFAGPEGVGKALAAKAFLTELMGPACPSTSLPSTSSGLRGTSKSFNALEHPDVMWIIPKKDKIKIEDIRKANGMLNLKPYEAALNACVIEDAHTMTAEASNALLKVLEEPPGKSLFILISAKRELLLPTVISRCVEVRFHSLSIDQTKNIIMRHSAIDEEAARFLAYFSEGSPGRALKMIDKNILNRKSEIAGLIESIMKEKNVSCVSWDREKKKELLEDLELMIMLFRDTAIGKNALAEPKNYPLDKIYGVIERLIELKWALKGNVNPKLVAQALPGELI